MSKPIKIILIVLLTLALPITGCSSSSTPEPPLQTHKLEINLLGETSEFSLNSNDKLESRVEASSADSTISLSLAVGTRALDKDRGPLQTISAIIDPDPPPPPDDAYIIGPIYNLEAEGAIFDPWLVLTLGYDPEKLPDEVSEDSLYIAYYNESDNEWHHLYYKKTDANAHTVTTQVYHFSRFTILAPKKASSSDDLTPGANIGNLAPNFQLYDLNATTISLSDLQGKSVLLNFWATWCSPCRVEMPYLQQIYEEWSDEELVLLAINLQESSQQVNEFMQAYGFSFMTLLDETGDVAQKYNIFGIPTTFFIDKDGIIRDIKIGPFFNKAEIENSINKIIP